MIQEARSPRANGARAAWDPWYDALYRSAFRLCVFTGLRAAFNRVRSRLTPGPIAAARLHGSRLATDGPQSLRVLVHRRPRPSAAGGNRIARPAGAPAPGARHRFGMISLRQEDPPVRPALYRYLCLTSHLGCGQLEVAFYCSGKELTIYALRDTARSSASRLGWSQTARSLGSAQSDLVALRALIAALEGAGLHVRLAPATECVQLALNQRLVPPQARPRTLRSLEQKYRRLLGSLAQSQHGPSQP